MTAGSLRSLLLLGPLVGVALAGCGSSAPAGAAFTSGSDSASCLVHQKHAPTTPYEGGASADSETELVFLRYVTAHGDQPFCDGKRANANDRKWGALYDRLTGNPDKARTLRNG